MDKRTLLAIALSIVVLVAFSFLTPEKPVQKQPVPQQADAPAPVEEVREEPPAQTVKVPGITEEIPADEDEKEIRVETDLYSVVFTTRGGALKKWDLKEYLDSEKNPVSLLEGDMPTPPLSIILDEKSPENLIKINYRADKDSLILDSYNNTGTLTLSYTDPSGLSIKKMLTFYRNDYRVDFFTEVKGAGTYTVVLGSGFGIVDTEGAWVHIGPVLLRDTDKIDIDENNIEGISFIGKFTGKKSKPRIDYPGNIRWIAQEDKYFTSALASVGNKHDAVVWSWENPGSAKPSGAEIAYKVSGEKGEFLLFAGPKQQEVLEPFNVGLEHIIDFGFFSPIARPLFWVLKLFYRILGNYGWAIILITIVVRIPFIPLINKGQKSMKRLQAVQPHMAAIKEKYKSDPQKLQKETMDLYKKHKVNPIGGCLPMLIQLPVFFALYKILLIAIEIRGAEFIWWIHDLSVKDPYYIFPVAMGLTMVIQQKMTPSGMDPKQAKMMMLMPVVFTFMFLSFPAGLVLYWLVSNSLGIVQQFFVNKKADAAAGK
jgi:YidC/Oxa1 family membrane protein insertase